MELAPLSLATPLGVIVVGVVLWFKVNTLEKEVTRLRDDRHELNSRVGEMTGAVETLRGIVTEVLAVDKHVHVTRR